MHGILENTMSMSISNLFSKMPPQDLYAQEHISKYIKKNLKGFLQFGIIGFLVLNMNWSEIFPRGCSGRDNPQCEI